MKCWKQLAVPNSNSNLTTSIAAKTSLLNSNRDGVERYQNTTLYDMIAAETSCFRQVEQIPLLFLSDARSLVTRRNYIALWALSILLQNHCILPRQEWQKNSNRKTLRKENKMSAILHVGASLAALGLISSVQAQLQQSSVTLGGPASTVSFPGGVTPFTVSPSLLENHNSLTFLVSTTQPPFLASPSSAHLSARAPLLLQQQPKRTPIHFQLGVL